MEQQTPVEWLEKEINNEHLMLQSALFTFTQDGNCVDGGFETIEIRCESSLGIDKDEGCFYVLKTDQWSIESAADLQKLFDRIEKAIKNK